MKGQSDAFASAMISVRTAASRNAGPSLGSVCRGDSKSRISGIWIDRHEISMSDDFLSKDRYAGLRPMSTAVLMYSRP